MKHFLSLFFVALVTFANAQNSTSAVKGNGKITGVVMDGAQPVEFATVALTSTTSDKPIDGSVCDDKGKFTIVKVPVGTYRLIISFIGYENVVVNDIVITDKKNTFDAGTIKMASASKELDAVVVEGQRQLVEEKVDRTIYNAESDQTTKGGDATDVLKRVPMLSVDMDGNVSMRGNSNIRVLINNKPSTITATSVADALKQIPADQIKTVEVITSPSAKYDAEGSAGIINIITKKNTLEGLTLNVDGSAGVRGSNLSLNSAYRKGKMGFSLGGFGRSGYNVTGKFTSDQYTRTLTRDQQTDSVYTHTQQSASTRNNNLFGSLQGAWDYDINKNNSLTASVRYGTRNNWTYQDHLLTDISANNLFLNTITNSSRLQDVNTTGLSGNVDASLNYTHTFNKPQRELSLLTLYSRNAGTSDFVTATLDEGDLSTTSRIKNINQTVNQEITVQADYQTPIAQNQMLELGGKNISREASSEYTYYAASGATDPYVPSTGGSTNNTFNYTQNITAGYAAYTYSSKSGYSIKAGSRYEYTTINANYAVELPAPNIPSYGVLVPSANIAKKLKNGGTLKAAYNKRIQRPSIQFLNPNVQAPNQYSISYGNPNLGPEYTNNYELSYSTFIKATSLNFSTFVRDTYDAIQPVKTANGPVITTTYRNIGKENAYGGSLFASVNVAEKLTLSGGTDIYYAMLSNNVADPLYNAHNEGWVASYRIFGNYTLGKGYGLQFFSFYRGRQVQLQGIQGSFYIYSLSIRKDLPNKKGSLGFGAEQFFTPAMRINSTTESPLISQTSVNELHNLNFKITFSLRLGKMSFDAAPKKRKKSVENDDLKDGGGGGDMGGGQDNNQGGQGGGNRGGAQGNRAAAVTTVATEPLKTDPTAVVNAEGSWSYTLESPQGGTGKLVIKKDGEKYSGTITSSRNNKETPLTSVTVVGNEINFAYEVNFGGNSSVITTKAVIDGDAMKGSMSVGQFGSFPINAKRDAQ